MQAPPKFSSFRPKVPVTPVSTAANHSSKQHDDARPPRKHESRYHNRHGSRSRSRPGTEKETLWAQEPRAGVDYEEKNDIFLVDRMGDPNNGIYGSNNKYAVPAYWTFKNDRILGEDVFFGRTFTSKTRLLSSLTRQDRQNLKREAKLVVPSPYLAEQDRQDLSQDFLRLKNGTRNKRHHVLGESRQSRLEQQPSGDEQEDSDGVTFSDTASSSGLDLKEDIALKQLKSENARLSARVKMEPGNAQFWEEYINFQDTWIGYEYEIDEQDPHAAQRNSAPVKLSIYEKALAAVGRNSQGRESLIMGMMAESEFVQENSKMALKWREIIKDNQHHDKLWLEYINFMQANFASFKLECCREQYATYLQGQDDEERSVHRRTHTFLRLTMLLSDAGYAELALALWQSLVELNCFSPTQLDDSMPHRVVFEDYWDRELPRIGEIGATGWCNKHTTTTTKPISNPTVVVKEECDTEDESLSNWYLAEKHLMDRSALPGRTIDESDGDDPYHVVLFSDIQNLLVEAIWRTKPVILVNAFLSFVHLPPLNDDAKSLTHPRSWQDSFNSNEIFPLSSSAVQSGGQNASITHESFDQLTQQHPTTTHTMFSTDDSGRLQSALDRLTPEKRLFVSRFLKTLMIRFDFWDELAEYSIAVEMYGVSPAAAKKTLRALLKVRSSNLRLYNIYGLVEARLGNKDASDKVFGTAISMSTTFSPGDRADVILLWRSWVWEALSVRDTPMAMRRIIATGLPEAMAINHTAEMSTNMSDVHTAEAYLFAGIISAIGSSPHPNIVHYVEILALLHYLSPDPESPSLTSALSSYAIALARVATIPSPIIELIHQSRAHLLSYHVNCALPYRPLDVRTALAESIALFPSNTIFLSLYRENEKRSRIDDRVRDIVKDMLHKPRFQFSAQDKHENDNIVTHAFAITTEIQRGLLAGSTAHSVRAAFARATGSRNCRNSATLWTAWVSYECSLLPDATGPGSNTVTGDDRVKQQKARVRNVFFQGLRHLPWHKRYAMSAWRLREFGCLDDAECGAVYEGMVERGLRLFCEMEGE